ncbi:IS66 family transposase zinc-finger binding domain-containing protein, partial [Klebsiella pneumoniae]
RAYCLKTQPATGETYPKSDLFNKAALSYLGEDAAEQLELMRSAFRVIRTVREKHACTKCDAIVQAPAPSRPIERGIAGPGLMARVLTSKYAEHTPLYR